MLLVGTKDIVAASFGALPAAMGKHAAILRKALPVVGSEQVKAQLTLALVRSERKYDEGSADRLAAAAAGTGDAVLGLDEILARPQAGHASELAVAQGIAGTLHECPRCGPADASEDALCAFCGSERRERTLRTLLPELARRHAVPVEIVVGRAARKLGRSGGIGAWLRTPRLSTRRSQEPTDAGSETPEDRLAATMDEPLPAG